MPASDLLAPASISGLSALVPEGSLRAPRSALEGDELAPHRVAAFAVQRLASAEVALGDRDNIAAPVLRLPGRLAAQGRGQHPLLRRCAHRHAGDRTARLWDATTGQEIIALLAHEGRVSSASFSPDGPRVITTSRDRTARLWDATTGGEIMVLRGHDGRVSSASFSPDGVQIVTASPDGTARLCDATTGKEIIALRGHEKWVRSASFSPQRCAHRHRLE